MRYWVIDSSVMLPFIISKKLTFLILLLLCVCVLEHASTQGRMCQSTHVEAGGQLCGVSFLLFLLYRSQGLNPGHSARRVRVVSALICWAIALTPPLQNVYVYIFHRKKFGWLACVFKERAKHPHASINLATEICNPGHFSTAPQTTLNKTQFSPNWPGFLPWKPPSHTYMACILIKKINIWT